MKYIKYFILALGLFFCAKDLHAFKQHKKPIIEIHYLGHSSFIIKFDNGLTILTDYGTSNSYDLPSPIYDFGKFIPDIVLYSHKHHIDHTGGTIPENIKHILTGNDSLTISEIKINPISTCEKYLDKSDNTSFLINYKGYKILHLGDPQAYITNINDQEVQKKIKEIYPEKYDLVMMPIGYVNDILAQAKTFLQVLNPKRMIPMHYWYKEDKRRFLLTLEKEKFFKIKRIKNVKYKIDGAYKDTSRIEVISLEPEKY